MFDHSHRRYLAAFVVVGLLFTILFTLQAALFQNMAGNEVRWGRNLGLQILPWCAWLLLSPILRAGFRAQPLGANVTAGWLLRMALFGVIISTLHILITALPTAWLMEWKRHNVTLAEAAQSLFINRTVSNLLGFTMFAAVYYAAEFRDVVRERELRTSRLEGQLAKAELKALKLQLQPHFLFNTLNAIASLVRREPETAERMIDRLSGLLRMVLTNSTEELVPLSREMEMVKAYLEIQEVRFPDRLTVRMSIAADLESEMVPPFLLQPIVENAITHGVAANPASSVLSIDVRREDGTMLFEISNQAAAEPPFAHANTKGTGVGLANTRARLENQYPGHFDLIVDQQPSLTRVRMRLPLTKMDRSTH
jgi:two-component system, LytTR family, sensor kinase